MPRRRADHCACALLSAQTPPTRHRAASAPSRLESRRSQSGADWERRLSAGFACRGLNAPGARSAAREPGGWPCRAAGRTTAHVLSDRPRRRRRGIEPRRRRAGWKAGDPGQPRTGSAGFQPASRAGGSMPPARDLRRGCRAVAHAAPAGRTTAHVPSYQPRRRRRGIEPRRRRAGWKAGDPSQPRADQQVVATETTADGRGAAPQPLALGPFLPNPAIVAKTDDRQAQRGRSTQTSRVSLQILHKLEDLQ
jgi:hypothetical protein